MTVAEAGRAAFKAGQQSGDTGLFPSWLEGKGLDGHGNVLRARLRKEYDAGVESNFETKEPATRRTSPKPADLNREFLKRTAGKKKPAKEVEAERADAAAVGIDTAKLRAHLAKGGTVAEFQGGEVRNPKFTREQLERMPSETLDRMAYGFASGEERTVPVGLLHATNDDIENAIYKASKFPGGPKAWARSVDFSEPIQLTVRGGKYFVKDGHHRYYAAKLLGKKTLRAIVEIDDNSIDVILGERGNPMRSSRGIGLRDGRKLRGASAEKLDRLADVWIQGAGYAGASIAHERAEYRAGLQDAVEEFQRARARNPGRPVRSHQTVEYNANSKRWRIVQWYADGSMVRLKGAFKTKAEAEAATVKANPITDRAHRYRANELMPTAGESCLFCGSKRFLVPDHWDGHPDHTNPENLEVLCKSCNTAKGNAFKKAGRGRLTHQYNPSKSGGASNVGEWINAVGAIIPRKGAKYSGAHYGINSKMTTRDAVDMIRATPQHKREEFADLIRRGKRGRASAAAQERWNPDSQLIRQAETARFPEELGRLHKHAIAHGDSALQEAVEARAGRLGIRLAELSAAHPRQWGNPVGDRRDVLRMKQDFLIMLAVDMEAYPETHVLTEGGPTLAQMRRYVYPDWEGYIDSTIRRIAGDRNVSVPDFEALAVKTRSNPPLPNESVQDQSWREWAENAAKVSRHPEKASEKDLRRAIGYLDHARRSMIRRAQESGKTVDPNVLAGYDNEHGYYVSLIRKHETKRNPAAQMRYLDLNTDLSSTPPDASGHIAGPFQRIPKYTPVEVLSRGRGGHRLLVKADHYGTPFWGHVDAEYLPVLKKQHGFEFEQSNPTWDGRPISQAERDAAYAQEEQDEAAAAQHAEWVRAQEARCLANPALSAMSAGQVNKAIAKLEAESSAINDTLIAAGRGHERAWDTMKLSDPLAMRYRDNFDRRQELYAVVQRETGPGFYKFPDQWRRSKRMNPGHHEIYPYRPRLFGPKGGVVDEGAAFRTREEMDRWLEWTLGGKNATKRKGWYVIASTPEGEERYGAGGVRSNPESSAAALYESFHGKPSTEELLITEDVHSHEHLAVLGRAVECWIDTPTGLRACIEFDQNDEEPIFVCSAEDGRQLYIEGGDQAVDLASLKMDGEEWRKDRMVLGQFSEPEPKAAGKKPRKHNLTYNTKKDFDQFETIDYQHDLGEETGVRPYLEYDPRNQHLYITGGQYFISQPLLETSPGIEN